MTRANLTPWIISGLLTGCFSASGDIPDETGTSSDDSGSEAGMAPETGDGAAEGSETTDGGADTGTGTGGDASSSDDGPDNPVCGDGAVEGDEACDDGTNDGSYGGCLPDCTGFGPRCGDGEVQEDQGEVCDDGNDDETDECTSTCGLPGGTVLWERLYNKPDPEGDLNDDGVYAIRSDGAGGLLVAGSVSSSPAFGILPAPGNSYGGTAWVRRYDARGEVLWDYENNEWPGNSGAESGEEDGREYITDLEVVGDTLIITEASSAPVDDPPEFLVRALDLESGDVGWTRASTPEFDTQGRPRGFALARFGTRALAIARFGDGLSRTYTAAGVQAPGPVLSNGLTGCHAVDTASDGSTYLACAREDDGPAPDVTVLYRFDANQTQAWELDYAGGVDGSVHTRSLSASADGFTALLIVDRQTDYIVRFDRNGQELVNVEVTDIDVLSVVEISTNKVLVGGRERCGEQYDHDCSIAVLRAYDADLNILWELRSDQQELDSNGVVALSKTERGTVLAGGAKVEPESYDYAAWMAEIVP